MPIFMDVHIVPGVKAKDVAEAHSKDLLLQEEHACKCMTYWIDETRETVFCLIEAPAKDAVVEMHRKAHGLIPHKIIEVNSRLVESFLGRIYDPAETEFTDEGYKVFSESSFRILLTTSIKDPVLLHYQLGKAKTDELLVRHNSIIKKNLLFHGGREVEQETNGFVISFASAAKAVLCAISIQNELNAADADLLKFKVSVNAGEPIENSNQIFGDTIQLGLNLCNIAKCSQIAIASSVKALISKDDSLNNVRSILTLPPQEELLLSSLYKTLQENWQDPEFNIDDYCHKMMMSKSQLYRKVIALTGFSPNQLVKEYRLEKAKELMKKQFYNIMQVSFDAGFTSPSYFTKCFKKKYGLLPMHYMELLH